MAKWIHDALTVGNVSAWHYWWLYNPYNETNEGLIGYPENRNAITKRFYALGNFSRFVRPGWTRIDVSGVIDAHTFATAYQGPAGSFAIVVINDSGGSLPFAATLANAHVTSVTPWATTTTAGLTSQASIPVSANQLSATVPYGVTTFVGTNDAIFSDGFD